MTSLLEGIFMLLTGWHGSLGRSLWATTKRSTLVDWQGLLAFGGKTFLLLLARRSLSSALCKYTVTTIFLWNQPLPAVEHQHDDCVHSCWEHSLCYASPWRLQGSLAPCPSQEKLKQHQCKSVRFSSTMYVRQYCPSVKVRGNPASVFQTVLLWSIFTSAAVALGILLEHVPYTVTSQVSCSFFKQPTYSATKAFFPSLFPSSSLPASQMLLFNSK